MRRSSSTRRLGLAAVAAILLLAPPLGAAETREASLAAEIEVARGSDVYLVVDRESAGLEVRSRGMVLDRVEIRRLGVRDWRSLLEPSRVNDAAIPAVLTITRSAPQRRQIVIAGRPAEDSEGDSSSGLSTTVADGRYACQLDNGWILEVRDHGERKGFWRRLWEQLLDPFGRSAAARRRPSLVLEMDTDDVERLRHLFRRDRTLLVR